MHFDFDLKSQIYLDDESGEKKNEWIMSNLRLRIQTTPFNCQSTLIGFCWIVIVWMLLKNFFFFSKRFAHEIDLLAYYSSSFFSNLSNSVHPIGFILQKKESFK